MLVFPDKLATLKPDVTITAVLFPQDLVRNETTSLPGPGIPGPSKHNWNLQLNQLTRLFKQRVAQAQIARLRKLSQRFANIAGTVDAGNKLDTTIVPLNSIIKVQFTAIDLQRRKLRAIKIHCIVRPYRVQGSTAELRLFLLLLPNTIASGTNTQHT